MVRHYSIIHQQKFLVIKTPFIDCVTMQTTVQTIDFTTDLTSVLQGQARPLKQMGLQYR